MKKILLALLGVFLVGCASVPPVILDRAALETKKIANIYFPNENVTFSHQEQNSDDIMMATAGIAGLLIGSALDAGTNKRRANNLTEVIKLVGNYNPNNYFKSSLNNEVRGIAFESPITIQTTALIKENQSGPRITQSYLVHPDLSGVTVSMAIAMPQESEEGEEIYYAKNYSSVQVTGNPGDDDKNKASLSENPELLVNAVESGITEVVQRFVADFNGENYVAKPRADGEYPVFESTVVLSNNLDDRSNLDASQSEIDEFSTQTSHPEIVAQLQSPSARVMRDAAKYAGENKLYNDSGIVRACLDALQSNVEGAINTDRYLIDGLSWCALNLGNARAQQALSVLATITNSEWPKKLRNHTIHATKVINGEIPVN